MDDFQVSLKINEEKTITKSDMMSLLKTYNCYHEGESFQLHCREEDGELIMEGLLNISWGLKRPIRLQMQDDNERLHYPCSGPGRWERLKFNGNEKTQQVGSQQNSLEWKNNISDKTMKSTETNSDEGTSEEESPQLMRTKSDASFMRRSRPHRPGDTQRLKRHRFSINGHFYNHKTSVFTPAYGSVTNVRVNSAMTTPQVLNLLLNKFRVENKSEEFALYVIHQSGERTKLKDTEYPLISRLLHGPCEKIARIFLMETDLGEEVTYGVAQYIKFEMPVLDSFVEKLQEEEEREISKLTRKYSALKSMILQQLGDIAGNPEPL